MLSRFIPCFSITLSPYKYIAVSKHLYNDQQYKSVLKAGEKYDSLTDAYVAYLLALEEYEKSALDSN